MRRTLGVVTVLAAMTARAEEGMWPYNMAPVDAVKARYGFEMTPAWLDRARAASVRFNNGGSGSFVSARGLVMTNHHVGADCIQKIAQAGAADVMAEGFLAGSAAEEQRCPDLELNVLRSIEDVTARVKAAEKGPDAAARNAARKAEMTAIEKACHAETALRCDVVTLYAGGAYHLYRYQKHTDVRLVFAPEFDAAFFGGDPDNFTFPRTCLDVAFFRVYEDNEPVTPEAFFPLSQAGPSEGELVFVSGNPGRTGRLTPPAELRFLRDVSYPYLLERLGAMATMLEGYMARGEAERRAGRDVYFGIKNALKAYGGYHAGLKDAAMMGGIEAKHAEVQQKLGALPEAERAALLEAWPKLAKAFADYTPYYRAYQVTERRLGPGGQLMQVARGVLRLTTEVEKPEAERLREYRDSNLDSVKLRLFSAAKITPSLEVERIAFGLESMAAALGADHAAVKAALGGLSARARAEAVVEGSGLFDPEKRKALVAGGAKAVAASDDPALALARAIDGTARELRARFEAEVEGVQRTYEGRIAQAWATAYGQSVYPDATFTLRINPGVVKGYAEGETQIPWHTTMGDLFARYDAKKGAAPWTLPKRWLAARAKLDPKVPYNFVTTNDIIGGNSGSPVIDRQGHAVGLIFDGNIHQLPNKFAYREGRARSISVHTAGILHALEVVYGAKALLTELAPK